jgi:hypothetical protein
MCSIDLVWDSIAGKLSVILDVWWEMGDENRQKMNAFRRVSTWHKTRFGLSLTAI